MILHQSYSFVYKDSFWFQKYQVYSLRHLFFIIGFFSKFNQVPVQQPENYLMNPCVQIFDSIQQKKLMKNQQVAKVSFKHFLAQPVA